MEKQAYMIISIVLAIGLIASVVVLGVVPRLGPGGAEVVRINMSATDFAFDPDELTVPAGTIILLVITNDGDAEHELMVVQDKAAVLTMMQNLANQINNDANYTTVAEKMEAFHEAHEEMHDMAYQGIEVDVEPGETIGVSFVIEDPGTYYFVCHETEGSWPQLHQSLGMEGTLIVE